MKISVNGKDRGFDAPEDMPLLWVLRDLLNLTGTKYGCGESFCGACTVHVDGKAVRSCAVTAASVAGKKVVTIEGLSRNASHPCQKAWAELDVVQCGYCQSGQIMQAAALLAEKPRPTGAEIDGAMKGNICRCGTYERVHAPAAPDYFHPGWGEQGTGGSSSTRGEYERLRKVGATARAMLVAAAAQKLKRPVDGLRTENGFVIAGDKKLSYGKLAAQAAALTPAADFLKLKDRKEFKIIGKTHKRLDTPEKIIGAAQFGIDVQFAGLLTAVVARPPTFGGKARSFKAAAALKVPGVKNVVEVPTGIAVVAQHMWRR